MDKETTTNKKKRNFYTRLFSNIIFPWFVGSLVVGFFFLFRFFSIFQQIQGCLYKYNHTQSFYTRLKRVLNTFHIYPLNRKYAIILLLAHFKCFTSPLFILKCNQSNSLKYLNSFSLRCIFLGACTLQLENAFYAMELQQQQKKNTNVR